MISWPAKDPAETLDYTWITPAEDGETITAHTAATVAGGAIAVDSSSVSGNSVIVWISGGVAEQTDFVELTATTSTGRIYREVAVLPVIDRASTLLAEFRLRYPEFKAVDDGTISYWLADAGAHTSWPEAERNAARGILAAHKMAEQGLGTNASAQGVTSFKSGTFSASVSEAQANRTGLDATIYGREYLALTKRHFGTPVLAWTP